MILHLKQSQIASDTHRFRVVNCGRRFGKTMLAIEEMIGMAISENDKRIAYYAPTRDDARDIVWGALIKKCEPIIIYANDARLELKVKTQKGGESFITLYGWESVQERGKGRGLANDFIILDEVAQYRNFWIGWEEVLSPTLVDRKGSALFISTPKGFNHFYELYNLEYDNKDYKSFHFTSFDNPYIAREEIEREKQTITNDRFSQEFLADFTKASGLVYKEFQRDTHIYSELPQGNGEFLGAVDFGYKNPAVVLHIHIIKDKIYIDDEFYKTQRTDAQIAEYVSACKFQAVYPDPENQGAIKELNDKNVNVREVVKNKDSVKSGIQIIREAFLQKRLFINKRCFNTIFELESYSYDDDRGDKNENENPIKKNDHAMDALRYALLSYNFSNINPLKNIPLKQRLR